MIRSLSVRQATSFTARLWGVKSKTAGNDCLYFPHCKAVHTFGVSKMLDLIWVNQNQQVVRIDYGVPSNRVKICWFASGVIEKPSFSMGLNLGMGDRLKLRGQALVETALVMPVLFLLLFGFMELSLMLQAQQKLTHAVNWGTQVGALTNSDAKINGALREFYEPETIEIAIKNTSHIHNQAVLSSDRRQHDFLQVQLTYPYPLNIPFMGAKPFDLTAQATARVLCKNSLPPYQCD